MVPNQLGMVGGEAEADVDAAPVLLSGAARASRAATAGYVCIAAGHSWLLSQHSQAASADGPFFAALAVVELALAFEAAVFALGAFGRTSGFPLLTVIGRLRLLGAAMAWPFLMPWSAELTCRCGGVSPATGAALLLHSQGLSMLIGAFFLLREVSYLVRGQPASALDASAPSQIGDCLPSQAVLGGHFRLDASELEDTGRAVFVPARQRHGLYVGSGLAMLACLASGVVMASAGGAPPYLLLGCLAALLGRRFDDVPKLPRRGGKDEDGGGAADEGRLWRREGPRLACRMGELVWIWCCLAELRRCEAAASWLPSCEVPP